MKEDLRERLERKRDRVHPTNRRPDLPMLIKLSFGDLERVIEALPTPQIGPSE